MSAAMLLAHTLFELEPATTYPERAAEALRTYAGALGVRLVVYGRSVVVGRLERTMALSQVRMVEAEVYGGCLSPAARRSAVSLIARGVELAARLGLEKDPATEARERIERTLQHAPLAPYLMRTAKLLASGYSVTTAAEIQNLKPQTVKGYAKRIYRRLGIHSRAELIAYTQGMLG